MTQAIVDEFDGNAHDMAAEIARLRIPLTVGQLIIRAHELGLHTNDQYFHDFRAAVESYVDECSDILRGLGKVDAIPDFIVWFMPLATNAMSLHDEPVYLLASFLGIFKLGEELEDDVDFQALEAVARPIRMRRLNIDLDSAMKRAMNF